MLRVLEERPGASVAELAAAAGGQRTVVHALLKDLDQRAEIATERLPGGTTGYRLAVPAPSEPAAAAPAPPAVGAA